MSTDEYLRKFGLSKVSLESGAYYYQKCIECNQRYGMHTGSKCPVEVSEVKPVTADLLKVQFGGDHYKTLGEYQPWEVLQRWMTPEEFRGYMKGTAVAYLARENQKGGDLDIEKAIHTLQGYLALARKEGK